VSVTHSTIDALSIGEDSAARTLHAMMRHRDTLQPLFNSTWDLLAPRMDPAQLEQWSACVLRLMNVNAGPSCLIAFWDESRHVRGGEDLSALLASGHAAIDICRHAGARAATTALQILPAWKRDADARELREGWRIICELAHNAPACVEAVIARISTIAPSGHVGVLADFIAVGLKLASGSKKRQLAFFTLQDPIARKMIDRDPDDIGFANIEREIKAFVTALWGRTPVLRGMTEGDNSTSQRRSSIAGALILLPDRYRGFNNDSARPLYQAAAAHAQAHLVFGGERFTIGKLKPLQLALISLIEDARVETLAMQHFPGLRRVWSPYHLAVADGPLTAPSLLARLARALFDPSFADPNGFIAKGRGMFEAVAHSMHDPAISREIGMLLGNDLGQMRVQFNAKTYVVEPAYRDDGHGLWDIQDHEQSPDNVLEMTIEAMRPNRQESPDSTTSDTTDQSREHQPASARPAETDERGAVVATYPEWDCVHEVERPDWTTVREVSCPPADPRMIDDALDQVSALRNRVQTIVRGARMGRAVRLRRQFEGHDIDIDAMLDAGIALRMQQQPDPRIFRSSAAKHRDISTVLLIDVSASTGDRVTGSTTVLDMERLSVTVVSEAMDQLGDPFSLLAFASDGRDDVRMKTVKAFAERYDRGCMSRLAGLTSGLSTRLGAALRHAGTVAEQTSAYRKLIIVLTDGEPSDVDVEDTADLVEDARRAVRGLHSRGIDCFGIVLGTAGMVSAARIFGRGNTMLVNRLEELPKRLSELYFRLACR